ncbi:sulfatase family protein [Shewanella sp. GXUN23E]|uniref:sulfatase family protein n=1 Tax=Shewanella sp. GXUN23E TaxID=3422498 RepID=UPI003D7CCFE7
MRLICLIVALLISTGCLSSPQEPATAVANPQRPNILWIYVEDMNDWMGAYGDHTVPTPNIDNLASQGVRFDQLIMPAPVCSAVRSAIIAGDMQTTLGLHNHRSARFDYNPITLPAGHKSVPELFRDAGYDTFNIGKDDYNFHYDRTRFYSLSPGPIVGHQGQLEGPEFDWAATVAKSGKPFFGQLQLTGGKYKEKNPPFKVDRNSLTLPPYYADLPLTREYWAMQYEAVHATDLDVGKVLAQLEQHGLLQNTAIFFFTDHGNGSLRHKQFLYDGGLQVPLVVSWPAGNEQIRKLGAVRSEPLRGLDIGGTSLGLAGIAIPDYMTTEDFFATDYQAPEWIISARDRLDYTFDHMRSVRTDRFKYIRNFMPQRPYMQPQYRDKWPMTKEYRKAYREGKFNEVQAQLMAPNKPQEELYDLKADPFEIHNLASDPAFQAQLRQMRTVLIDWMAATDDKGQYPESDEGVREVLEFYKDCASPECLDYLKRHPKNQ